MLNSLKKTLLQYSRQLRVSGKWILLAVTVGTILGFVGTAFFLLMTKATALRLAHPWLLYFLPAGGLLIAWLYHVMRDDKDAGTNLVLSAVHSDEKLPPQMAPLIFICTLITHLFGGSAGREGAALQIGGSIANTIGELVHLDEKDRNLLIMCGMSAGFSAIFGTPMAATVFAIEVISVGIMQYAALVPCAISALLAHGIASHFLDQTIPLTVTQVPSFTVTTALYTALMAVICGIVSIIFCILLHESEALYKRIFPNVYLRIAAGGCVVIALTLLFGTRDYNGISLQLLARCFAGTAVPGAFALKLILTVATLGSGYKGGEIVPSMIIGAALGSTFAGVLGLSPSLCAAVGLGSMFCAVTNCPIASLLICFELFGIQGLPYYLLAIALSYALSGYYGLYSSQKIAYSKYKAEYINRKTRDLE
ncbi:MAG: chloride channel protein [Lachnospiraceae bacterium]|jgi:H+/Cl- antiporter ClcA|nr:chloride channel protein [Lachnospiraceae bacterium]MCI1656917.1 chloride channel protein [Lachnospiraceae bacterium]MCI2195397.1 chloride channel protein [Lachnospiraceae bacterium]